jgi:hypothetical protein
LAALFLCVPPAQAAPRTPEELVRQFYAWYFMADAGNVPAVNNKAIFTYVAPQTVKKARETSRIYYFTRVGSYSSEWIEVKVAVGKAVTVTETLAIVPVSFCLPSENRTVAVVVGGAAGKRRITQVLDQYLWP